MEFMQRKRGQTVQVLVEENNTARDQHDIAVKISSPEIPARTVCDVILTDIKGDAFVATAA